MNHKILRLTFLIVTALWFSVVAQAQPMPKSWEEPLPSGPVSDDYPLSEDSQRHNGVPQGKVIQFLLDNSKIFPNTRRNISVYVPAQYKGDKPACVYVALDGLGFNAPVVFDNLIHKKEIPILIGIGIGSGDVSTDGNENPRHNRSFEFDGLNDNLARFLTEEVFPFVERQKTSDGLPLLLSKDPNERCAAGGSTGGIGAFTLAWERPDQFRRVFSAIGTFVGMRGGDRYPVLVRKTEPKPLRIFLQDGHHDQWLGGPEVGDWWISNVAMNRALEFSGYDVQHVWGTGPHSGNQAAQAFPDAMRFLWKDYPKPLTAQTEKSLNIFLKQILKQESGWIAVAEQLNEPVHFTADSKGTLYVRDNAAKMIYRLQEDGTTVPIIKQPGNGGVLAFGTDEQLYAADTGSETILVTKIKEDSATEWVPVTNGVHVTGMDVLPGGELYVTDSRRGVTELVLPNGTKTVQGQNLKSPSGVAVTPDGLWLAVVESGSHWGTSYRLKNDNTLDAAQRYYWFHVPDAQENLGGGDCCFDADGRLYVASHLGVSVLDRNGRTRAILPSPVRGGQAGVTAIRFGGSDFSTLYIISDGKIFKRSMNVKGSPVFRDKVKLPNWGAG